MGLMGPCAMFSSYALALRVQRQATTEAVGWDRAEGELRYIVI